MLLDRADSSYLSVRFGKQGNKCFAGEIVRRECLKGDHLALCALYLPLPFCFCLPFPPDS